MSTATIDQERLDAFMGRVVGDLGATCTPALVGIGDRLGLYQALADGEPAHPGGAGRADGHDRAASARVAATRRPPAATSTTTPDAGTLPADPRAGLRARRRRQPGLPARARSSSPRRAARRAEHHRGLPHRRAASAGTSTTTGCSRARERFFRPGYVAQPRHRVAARAGRRRGQAARRAHASPTSAAGTARPRSCMAQAFPRRRSSAPTTTRPRSRPRASAPRDAGVADRVTLRGAPTPRPAGRPYDLVTLFDCLHDMGDPVGAARASAQRSPPDGTLMVVEPLAGDQVEDNLNPVGPALLLRARRPSARPPRCPSRARARAGRAGRRVAPLRGAARGRLRPRPPRRGDAVQHGVGGAPVAQDAVPAAGVGSMPAAGPRATTCSAILRVASSIISPPNITAPRRSRSVATR